MTDFFNANAPNGLSVIVMAVVPAIAFCIPWWLAKRDTAPTGKPRRQAILMFAFPILIGWIIVHSLLTPVDHLGTPPEISRAEAVMVRSPRTIGELFIRAGVGGFGAALLIWACGAIGAKIASTRREQDAQDAKLNDSPRTENPSP